MINFQKLDLGNKSQFSSKRPLTPVMVQVNRFARQKVVKIFRKGRIKDYSFIDQCKRVLSSKVKDKKSANSPYISNESVKPLEISVNKFRYVRAYTPNEKLPEERIKKHIKIINYRVSAVPKSSNRSYTPLKDDNFDKLEGW